MMRKQAHIFVSGRVQGVFFRAWVADRAPKLGLSGWVRNRLDGRVEAVFEGPSAEVGRMVEWCREGPAHARVESVVDDYGEPSGISGFEVRDTF